MVQFLVATMNGQFDPVASGLSRASCVVINQIDADKQKEAELWALKLRRSGTIVENVVERGLSKSRNRAIKAATEEICVITDDDVVYKEDIEIIVQSLFDGNPDADAITFQASDRDGMLLRNYRKQQFRHTRATACTVQSIEIAFRRSAVMLRGIEFDERFGLGAQYVSGEENIFIADLVARGLKVLYVPVVLVSHPRETSGSKLEDDQVVRSKGALIQRVFRSTAIPVILLFAVKKSIEKKMGIFRLLRLMWAGRRALNASL